MGRGWSAATGKADPLPRRHKNAGIGRVTFDRDGSLSGVSSRVHAGRGKDVQRPAWDGAGLYTERPRQQGLRSLRMWVPDDRASGFAVEAHRQSRAVAAGDLAHGDQNLVDAVWL